MALRLFRNIVLVKLPVITDDKISLMLLNVTVFNQETLCGLDYRNRTSPFLIKEYLVAFTEFSAFSHTV